MEENIKIEFRETGWEGVGCIELDQKKKDKLRAVLKMMVVFRVR